MAMTDQKLTLAEVIWHHENSSSTSEEDYPRLVERLTSELLASQTALRRYVEAEMEIAVNDEFGTSWCCLCDATIDEYYKTDGSFPHESSCPVHEARAALLEQGETDA